MVALAPTIHTLNLQAQRAAVLGTGILLLKCEGLENVKNI